MQHVLAPEDLTGRHRGVGERERSVASAKSSTLAKSSPWYGDASCPGVSTGSDGEQRVHRDAVRRHLERDGLREVVHRRLVAAVREHRRTAGVLVRSLRRGRTRPAS